MAMLEIPNDLIQEPNWLNFIPSENRAPQISNYPELPYVDEFGALAEF